MNQTQSDEQEAPQTGRDPVMLFFVVFLVVYFLLQLVILPRLGIPT